jgi:hypothetical protein
MLRKTSVFAVALVLVLVSASLWAGGPPRLCLPIDGVTDANADACAKLLAEALGDKLWSHPGRPGGVQIHRDGRQAYATCYLERHVALGDVEAALKGSEFSVPRDKLRLFGHVTLEIDAGEAAPGELIADLAAIDFLSVEESKSDKGVLRVTVDMPYPATADRVHEEWTSFRDEVFQWTDFSSDQSRKSEAPAKARDLPSYGALREVVAKHKASLKDLHWNSGWGCRLLGGVAVEK